MVAMIVKVRYVYKLCYSLITYTLIQSPINFLRFGGSSAPSQCLDAPAERDELTEGPMS